MRTASIMKELTSSILQLYSVCFHAVLNQAIHNLVNLVNYTMEVNFTNINFFLANKS